MKNDRPLLAIAVSTVLAAFALTPSAQADEPAPAPDSSDAPAAEAPTSDAPTSEARKVASPPTPPPRVDAVAPPPLALTRSSSVTTPQLPIVEQGPRSPGLGTAGIVTAVLGGGAVATGIGLAAAQEDGAAPTLLVGSLLSLTGVVMTGAGYSSPSVGVSGAGARRSARVAPEEPEPSWEQKQASRETHREVGIGLTAGAVVLGGGGAALLAVGVEKSRASSGGFMSFDFDGLGEKLLGGTMMGVGTILLAVGIPLWAANSSEEPRPPVRTELGLGPGSIELRGSF